MRTVIKLFVIVALTVVWMLPGRPMPIYAQGSVPPEFVQHVREQLRRLGKTTLTPQERAAFNKLLNQWRKGDLEDIPVGVDPNLSEFNPTVAANPMDPAMLVAGSQYHIGDTIGSCVVYTSSNGGLTWTAPVPVPLLSDISRCSNPVIAYAPDGSRVYYAYVDSKFTSESLQDGLIRTMFDWDVMVRTSNNNGMTWSDAAIALDGMPTSFLRRFQTGEYVEFASGISYYRPWISTPQDAVGKDWVYITATRRDPDAQNPENCYISFVSSKDGGASWDEPVILDQNAEGTSCGTYGFIETTQLDGSRPAGGKNGRVLVAWYHAGSDGPGIGEFEIRTRTSTDHGATWNEIVTAVTDTHERHIHFQWLAPSFPDVEIDAKGGAHISYSHDPTYPAEGEPWDADDGDIRYIQSSGAPYNTWSAPVTVNDDGVGHTQSWATLETQLVRDKVYVYLMWADFRLSPADVEEYYDVFSSWKRSGDSRWSANHRITDESSFLFEEASIGDYFDMTSNSLFAYGVWIDHRDIFNTSNLEHDVYGSWIIPIH